MDTIMPNNDTITDSPAPRSYKVISVSWQQSGWTKTLENKLNELGQKGFRPILYGDSGNESTIILEKIGE
jgi:hypothetical protein